MLSQEYSCDFKGLYEAVTNNLKVGLSELQNNIKKVKKKRRELLADKIRRMEHVFGVESEQFGDAVRELNKFDDTELKERANKYRDFVLSNNEKPTKAFCLLGKENNLMDDCEQICDDNNRKFECPNLRRKYISNYYGELYKKKLDMLMSIEEFLGRDTLELDWLLEKKLNEDERMSLEGDITLEEVDRALKTCNMNSSSGWDGISNKVIKLYFPYLGPLLVKLARNCFETSELNTSFKLGQIKLIPKKGEASKIGDWRPITLLSCGYKLISGTIAFRMEGFLDKIIGRAQKGFMGKKFMSTCTINIMDRIGGAWHHREPLGIMCIDFNKAFDSVEHMFIENVLKFFNFGDNFINMIKTLLHNRQSMVRVGDMLTEPFDIKRGTPQGDRISPYIFIICIEILLIKLKRLEGRGINNCRFIRDWTNVNGMNGEGNAEGFADDISVLFEMSPDAVLLVKNVLEQFKLVSGLSLNVGKTQLMVAGCDEYVIGSKVHDIEVVEQVKILGIKIDRKLERLEQNWDEKIDKMIRLSNFWRLQRLKISGRILVAKTFLLSQVVFLLETLPLLHETGERINKLMVDYVKGTDRVIAKKRWFTNREWGGYGLIDIFALNNCVKASWINRWVLNYSNADIVGGRGIGNMDKPVDQWGVSDGLLHSDKIKSEIMQQWRVYKQCFYRVNGNFGKACLFENDGLLAGKPNIGLTVFGHERYNGLSRIRKMVIVERFFRGQRILDKVEIDVILGINMNMAEYFRLRNVLFEIKGIYGNLTGEGRCLDLYMRGKKHSGGELRRNLMVSCSPAYFENDPRRVPSAISLWGGGAVDEANRELIEMNFGLWGISQLSSEFSMFLFNLVQGKLYLNNVLANFDNISPKCTFCELMARRDLVERGFGENDAEFVYYLGLLPNETVSHLFWECEPAQTVVQRAYRWLRGMDWYRGVEEIQKTNFMMGTYSDNNKKLSRVDLIWKHFVKFYIYKCRITRKLPMFPSLKFELEGLFSNRGMYKMRSLIVRINELYL